MVLALGTSRPDSTIIVLTRMSSSPVTKRCITSSSGVDAICPCATPTRARGASARTRAAMVSIVSTRLCTKNTWPPRSSSRAIASSSSPSSHGSTKVRIGERSRGGVSMSVRSRSPASDRCSVRGIGVAVSVSTSTARRRALSRSLCFTPNRCSSSTTRRPEVLEGDVGREQAVRADDDVDLAQREPRRAPPSVPSRCGSARAPRSSPG